MVTALVVRPTPLGAPSLCAWKMLDLLRKGWGCARGMVHCGTPGPPAQLLLPLLCWALTSPSTGKWGQPPSITNLRMPAEPPRLGEKVRVSCEAVSVLPELTLLYWLGNGSFLEKLYPDGAMYEGMVLEEPRGSGVTLRRDLHLDSFGSQHLHTNFTCVLLSPLGVATRDLRWLLPAPAPAPTPTKSWGLG
ncbi:interleukin-18-binding protein-like [Numenius arquata]|uniref:interleukin-18-binding protein-like n=1 Tax=Numenius arquata TaxID=31919 RepID=UPI003D3092D8